MSDAISHNGTERTARVMQTLYLAALVLYVLSRSLLRISWSSGVAAVLPTCLAFNAVASLILYALFFAVIVTEAVLPARRGEPILLDRKDKVTLGVLGICCALTFHEVGFEGVRIALMFFLARLVPFRRVAATLLFAFAAVICIAAVSCFAGLSTDVVAVFDYATCHSMGFTNANGLGLYLFLAFLCGWSLYDLRNRLVSALACLAASAIIFALTGCRTALVVLVLLAVLSALPDTEKIWQSKAVKATIILLPLIMTALSFLVGYILVPFDGMSDGNFFCRFVEGIYALQQGGVHLFNWDYTTPERIFYFDNGYFYWLLRLGLLAGAGLLGCLTFTNARAASRGRKLEIVLIVCLAVYFTVEQLEVMVLPLLCAYCQGEPREDPE